VPTSYPAEFYGKESDLDKSDEDRDSDDDDDDGSDSEHKTDETTQTSQDVDTSADNAPVESPHNRQTRCILYPPNPISHYPSAAARSHTCLPPITTSTWKHTDGEAENIILWCELEKMQWEKEATLMHAMMARLEVDEMVMKLNSRNKKFKKLPTMSVPDVWWLTGPKGREQWKHMENEQEAKRQKKAEVAARKKTGRGWQTEEAAGHHVRSEGYSIFRWSLVEESRWIMWHHLRTQYQRWRP
jgi:hypothetical protein